MSEFICSHCGYRKTMGNEFGNVIESAVFPMYEPSIVTPFLAMEYVQDSMGDRCPGCGNSAKWQRVDE